MGSYILPKHLWQPFIATHQGGEIAVDLTGRPEMLTGTGPFKFAEKTTSTLTLVRNPFFHQRMDKTSMHVEYAGDHKLLEGITVTALSPSVQITSYKIQVDTGNRGHVKLTVPITNLNADNESTINADIKLIFPNGSTTTLCEVANLAMAPLEIHSESFELLNLTGGKYMVNVTAEVTAGEVHDWVTSNLPSELWTDILGPKTIMQSFWITVPSDINEDGLVDIFDITPVAVAFGSRIGGPNFNRLADLTHDCLIDIFDIVKVAIWFGWHP